jgi:hypothetical protein
MASFRFRSSRWQARVRRLGYSDETRSFLTHQEAARWARVVESEMDQGCYNSPAGAQKTTLGARIKRCIADFPA